MTLLAVFKDLAVQQICLIEVNIFNKGDLTDKPNMKETIIIKTRQHHVKAYVSQKKVRYRTVDVK